MPSRSIHDADGLKVGQRRRGREGEITILRISGDAVVASTGTGEPHIVFSKRQVAEGFPMIVSGRR